MACKFVCDSLKTNFNCPNCFHNIFQGHFNCQRGREDNLRRIVQQMYRSLFFKDEFALNYNTAFFICYLLHQNYYL